MTIKTIAAIDVGSYEIEMKIFEISAKKGIVMIDHLRQVIELGKDTYANGHIDFKHIEELCVILDKFTGVMKEYGVKDYVAYATSSIREARNKEIVLDRIAVKTGLRVQVLSNSEQRFIGYKALSLKSEFAPYIQEGTAIVDVSAGSIQISLFDKDSLVTTQNIKLGSLRIRELLYKLSKDREHFESLIEELINNDLQTFKKMYLKDRSIKNIIATGDYIRYFATKNRKYTEYMTRKNFMDRYKNLAMLNTEELSEKIDITEEEAALILPCIKVYQKLIEETETEKIWFPDMDFCDGIAAEFAIDNGIIRIDHNFDNDIINASRNISKRFKASQSHINFLENNVLLIFDTMKKIHGLGDRERMLLQISAILHDCGKYISMNQPGDAAYNIIMSTEIIGLSHREREIVANIVRYNTEDFFEDSEDIYNSEKEDFMLIAKLVAILRVANAMDRSHKQKFKDSKAIIKDGNTLVITTYGNEDITLEAGLFTEKAEFFKEVYGVKPVLKQKK